ncbi:MAG: penicillin-binding protein activator LpoB [candidate division Zixibacteria bacterium]|nr:penicillin-binding protein activator LpoB [candidate division Zixibacteria bacterium]
MKKAIAILLAVGMLTGCGGGGKTVTRLEVDSVQDLSGKWNDTDSRLVAEEMVADCMSRPWLNEFSRATGKKPVVTVGTIKNNSSEHINTETFSTDFERELINSSAVRFVAGKDVRAELRGERQEQQEFASPETMKKFRAETGADFLLLGSINTIADQEGGKQVMFYQTDLQLVNIETMEKVWIGMKKIKKGIAQGKTKW